jgi:ABC-type branched-subunit amino acid transport system ATPase component
LGHVLESGQIVISGSAAALLDDARVQQAYLGQGSMGRAGA